jgi:hypothetical protein
MATQTRKACKKPLRRKTCRGSRGRRHECDLTLRGKAVAISVKGVLQKRGWLSINNERIYIARENSRFLAGLPLETKASFDDASQTIRIGSTTVQIPRCAAYERVKEYIKGH